MLNIRFVTINPPTTLMVANTSAANPRITVTRLGDAEESIAPIIVIPEIALLPDIKGVCRSGGTFVMISNPTKTASMKIVSNGIKTSIVPQGYL